jgi:hypothetical protein
MPRPTREFASRCPVRRITGLNQDPVSGPATIGGSVKHQSSTKYQQVFCISSFKLQTADGGRIHLKWSDDQRFRLSHVCEPDCQNDTCPTRAISRNCCFLAKFIPAFQGIAFSDTRSVGVRLFSIPSQIQACLARRSSSFLYLSASVQPMTAVITRSCR